jgi:hypothetical protein
MGRCAWRRRSGANGRGDPLSEREHAQRRALDLDPSLRPDPPRAAAPPAIVVEAPTPRPKPPSRAAAERLRRAIDAVHDAAVEFAAAHRAWRREGARLSVLEMAPMEYEEASS